MSTKYDAQLHLLRSTARYFGTTNTRSQHDIESARFNVFSALEGGDNDRAKLWLRSLETAIRAAMSELPAGDATRAEITSGAFAAIAEIRQGLETEQQEKQ